MDLSRSIAEQLARPAGLAGQLIGSAMDLANRRPTKLALELLALQPGERALDAGCGTGATLDRLLRTRGAEAWGIDPSPAMIATARRRLKDRASLSISTTEEISFGNDFFDAVIALNVFYFAAPDNGMMRKLWDVLRPGGRLVAYVTHRKSMEAWPFVRAGLHRLYDAAELEMALISAGFANERIQVQEKSITPSVTGLLALAVKQD